MAESTRRRSRNGCFTCKTRKVRCTDAEEAFISNRPCNNCERLGLACRWRAPAPGEHYTPPPKRRRQSARRQFSPAVVTDNVQLPSNSAIATSIEVGQHSPQLDFPDPLFAVDINDWGKDLDLDSLDFMLPDAHYQQSSGYSETSLDPPWNLESIDGRIRELSTSITDEDSQLIQHYLHTLQGYAKIPEHPKDLNVFLSVFFTSLSFRPLYYAILAFSSAHLAMNDPSFTEQAIMYDRMSTECFETFRFARNISVEGLLSAIFIRVKMVHITGGSINRFLELMQIAADILTSNQGLEHLNGSSPAFSRRIIIRLSLLDARAASYRLGGGQFIRRVRDLPPLADIFSTLVHIDPAAEGIMCLLQVGLIRMQIADLDSRIHLELESETIVSPPIRMEEITSLYASIDAHIRSWESSMKCDLDFERLSSTEEVNLSAASYRDYTVLSALHSTRLYLCLVFPLPTCPAQHSVSRVLHCEFLIKSDTSRANSPGSLMPAPLFLAGVCTTDLIHRDWILKHLEQGERWGTYIRKVGILLRDIVRTRFSGGPVDILAAMERTTGAFVI